MGFAYFLSAAGAAVAMFIVPLFLRKQRLSELAFLGMLAQVGSAFVLATIDDSWAPYVFTSLWTLGWFCTLFSFSVLLLTSSGAAWANRLRRHGPPKPITGCSHRPEPINIENDVKMSHNAAKNLYNGPADH